MALGDFWSKIRSLYRRLSPQRTVAPQRPTYQPPRQPQAPVAPQPPTAPPVGPLDNATIIDTIIRAGKERRMLQITYDGVTRLVEPYSFRERPTGRQFYGHCSIHNKIHSFIPSKITAIYITNIPYSPRWDVEL